MLRSSCPSESRRRLLSPSARTEDRASNAGRLWGKAECLCTSEKGEYVLVGTRRANITWACLFLASGNHNAIWLSVGAPMCQGLPNRWYLWLC